MNPDVVSLVLQFGFAGTLLVFVYFVNRQFLALVGALEKHLERLTNMLEIVISDKVRE